MSDIEIITESHIMPMDDVIEHKESENCECCPEWDPENRKHFEEEKTSQIVWVHKRIKDELH